MLNLSLLAEKKNKLTRFVDALEDVVAAFAARVGLPLVAPLALAFAFVLVEEVGFYDSPLIVVY